MGGGPNVEAFEALVREAATEPGRLTLLLLQKYAPGADVDGALRAYMERMLPLMQRFGGRIIWTGRPIHVLIGDPAEDWDAIVIAEFPDRAAFLQMIGSEGWAEIDAHRAGALERDELYACEPHVDAIRGPG